MFLPYCLSHFGLDLLLQELQLLLYRSTIPIPHLILIFLNDLLLYERFLNKTILLFTNEKKIMHSIPTQGICGGLNENIPQRCMCLNIWSPVGLPWRLRTCRGSAAPGCLQVPLLVWRWKCDWPLTTPVVMCNCKLTYSLSFLRRFLSGHLQ